MTPHGYNVLMGLNINGNPKKIFESYFSWHHNGPGSITNEAKLRYADCVLEYRESPTLLSADLLDNKKDFKVAVLARNALDTGVEIQLTGLDIHGQPVHTSIPTQAAVAAGMSAMSTVYGAPVQLAANKLVLIDNIHWLSLESLTKPITHGDVDFYMVYRDCVEHIATITPFQTKSLYRIYEIPTSSCRCGNVEALVKIGEPTRIVNSSQFLIIDDFEALLALVMSIDETFTKKDVASGQNYASLGVASLAAELNSSRAPSIKPMQVLGMDEEINTTPIGY